MIMDVSRFVFIDFEVDMPRWKHNVFVSIIINGDGYACWGVGHDNEEFSLSLNLQYGFMNCAKTIVDNICDFSSTWRGFEAKWL